MPDSTDNADSELVPFEEVYRRNADRIYRFCLGQVRNISIAEDLGAATFEAAYNSYAKTRPAPDEVHLWLFRIAHNLVIDHRRKESRRDRINQIIGRTGASENSIEQIAATNAELAKVLAVMAQMKKRDRQLIALRVAGGLSNREAADVLRISEVVAAGAYHRALARFRRISEETP